MGLINESNIGLMRPDAVLLNFSREGVVSHSAVLDALGAKELAHYVCDFPEASLLGQQHIVSNLARGEGQRGCTRWFAAQAGTGGGTLMLMNLQGAARSAVEPPQPARNEGGFMSAFAGLADRAGEAALQAIVNGSNC